MASTPNVTTSSSSEAKPDETSPKYRDYLHGQVRELLTGYGKVDYIFFDFSYPPIFTPRSGAGRGSEDWGSEELLAMVRQLQPGIVVNDRLDLPGDVTTPEQYQPAGPMRLRRRPDPLGGRADPERELGLRQGQPRLEAARAAW